MQAANAQAKTLKPSNSKSEMGRKNVVMLEKYGTHTFPSKYNEALS